ncbi:Glycosyltransferase involved in cell wall bisynthesis [Modicisalibacter muralis]|uniref:Glycosyltransferase involved in cell wall bisynthesis n=1 Tax=Modicisalibacter muralis TaxID=119000 RepID=A0A1G9EUJ9_9GAMM|nr:glycosyltransferase [Halomonas muralis]SDK79819.1 Glycosyltransferase involved in cell wall bisynthesis [Halomonas muralis]
MEKLSVLMSVYNKENIIHLHECLLSLARQTTTADEVVLVEDGKINSQLNETIEKFRTLLNIKSIKMTRNVGLGKALQEGLLHCTYELVARMDADDIAYPTRFMQQVEFMSSHADISVCGGWIKEFSTDKDFPHAERRLPCTIKEVRTFARRRCPLNHMTVMFRKSHILAVGGYAGLKNSQDYHLWGRLLGAGYHISNIPDYLVLARAGENLFSRRGGWRFINIEYQLQREFVRSGFIGWPQAIYNLVSRIPVRLAPTTVRRFLYQKMFRNSI